VRVVGQLDAYNNITSLKAMHIRPVLDMHEPFFHFLEAMVALVSKQKVFVGNFWVVRANLTQDSA